MNDGNHAHLVLEIISRKTGIPVSRLSLGDRILQDLGIDGDDASELLIELMSLFQIDMSKYSAGKHFRPEPSLLTALRRPSSKRKELEEKMPVTIGDLIEASVTGKWHL